MGISNFDIIKHFFYASSRIFLENVSIIIIIKLNGIKKKSLYFLLIVQLTYIMHIYQISLGNELSYSAFKFTGFNYHTKTNYSSSFTN